eukprot:GFYU01042817.1.p1 GENE.GFYU01042817.1~~GFYU01042817.1.p1  ORF type:complete len:169 (-),score=35.83 GFYU01042817.1:71-577(-)
MMQPEAPPVTAPQPVEQQPPDILTQLQDQIDHQSFLIFTSIGVLQRDAAAIPVDNEKVTKANVQANNVTPEAFTEMTSSLAKQVVANHKAIDAIIGNVHDVTAMEERQLQRLEELEEENQKSLGELKQSMSAADSCLDRVASALQAIIDTTDTVEEGSGGDVDAMETS